MDISLEFRVQSKLFDFIHHAFMLRHATSFPLVVKSAQNAHAPIHPRVAVTLNFTSSMRGSVFGTLDAPLAYTAANRQSRAPS